MTNFYRWLFITITGGLFVFQGEAHAATFTMPVTAPWFDTGIDIFSGQRISITANGTVSYATSSPGVNADGIGPGYDGNQKLVNTTIPNTIHLSLIGKVGGTTGIGDGTPVPEGLPGKGTGFVGSAYDQIIPYSGRLFLGLNDTDSNFGDNSGSFSIQVVPEPSLYAFFAVAAVAWVTTRRTSWRWMSERKHQP
jgi:hypothetical protein